MSYKPVTLKFKPFLLNDVPSQAFEYVDRTNPVIVQIGANDGITSEEYGFQEFLTELDKFKLYLLEPLQKYYDCLKSSYGKFESSDKLIQYLNYAITDNDGEHYMVDLGGCSHISNEPSSDKIIGKSWDSFVSEQKIIDIDLLMLDCEGYEYTILKSIDYNLISPKVIRYEYFHIPEKEECDNMLIANGYSIELCNTDPIHNKIARKL